MQSVNTNTTKDPQASISGQLWGSRAIMYIDIILNYDYIKLRYNYSLIKRRDNYEIFKC